jgi:hypothetical protein
MNAGTGIHQRFLVLDPPKFAAGRSLEFHGAMHNILER